MQINVAALKESEAKRKVFERIKNLNRKLNFLHFASNARMIEAITKLFIFKYFLSVKMKKKVFLKVISNFISDL